MSRSGDMAHNNETSPSQVNKIFRAIALFYGHQHHLISGVNRFLLYQGRCFAQKAL